MSPALQTEEAAGMGQPCSEQHFATSGKSPRPLHCGGCTPARRVFSRAVTPALLWWLWGSRNLVLALHNPSRMLAEPHFPWIFAAGFARL